jgi:crossover junction endodeoxyribonuclease RuvC
LGIDPGTRRTGYGLLTVHGGVLRHLASGTIVPPAKEELPQRLLFIHGQLADIIDQYRPHEAAVEDIFFARHAQGALKLGHARGVALLAAAQAGIALQSYAPALIKRSLSGHGRASKEQIARLVTMLLCLPEQPQEDQADALSVAICHAAARSRQMRRTGPPP